MATCQTCKSPFQADSGGYKNCPQHRGTRQYKPRGCEKCGVSFTPTGGNQPRCPECQATTPGYDPHKRRAKYLAVKRDPARLAKHRKSARKANQRRRQAPESKR